MRPEPRAMVLVELRMGVAVRGAHASGVGAGYPPIMVAANGQVFPPHQEIAPRAAKAGQKRNRQG